MSKSVAVWLKNLETCCDQMKGGMLAAGRCREGTVGAGWLGRGVRGGVGGRKGDDGVTTLSSFADEIFLVIANLTKSQVMFRFS